MPGLHGEVIDLSAYRGKKLLIVNTASRCGFTPQYRELEELSQRYADRLVVIGFPCNNFLFQEPGSNEAIAAFCEREYHVTFPMGAKVSVMGPGKAVIYRWLTRKRYNGYADSRVHWNFQKYLVDERGQLAHIFAPRTSPLSTEVIAAVEE